MIYGTLDAGRLRKPYEYVSFPIQGVGPDPNSATDSPPIAVDLPRPVSDSVTYVAEIDDPLGDPNSIEIAKISSMIRRAINELEAYKSFWPGWDGYFAPAFDPELVLRAQRLCYDLQRHLESDRVVPTEITPGPISDGALDIEIAVGQKVLVFTLYPKADKVVIYKRWDHAEDEFTKLLTEEELERLFSWLCS